MCGWVFSQVDWCEGGGREDETRRECLSVGLVANGKVGMKDRCAHARLLPAPLFLLLLFLSLLINGALRQHQQQPIFAHRYANIPKLEIAVEETVFKVFGKLNG